MKSTSNKLATGARYLQGATFLLFGLNGFFQFLPQPPAPDAAMSFAGALFATGYMFPLIKGTEVVAALLLLSNRFVPLALAVLAPIVVNAVAFHLFLAPGGSVPALLMLVTELVLAWSYRDAFAPMLKARVSPSESRSHGVRARAAGASA